jgi:indolepyruvate ferredoxin oxidoreductase alpha subunit
MMGDGGFWHNGLTSGVGNAVFNQTDNLLLVVDNGYSAATGGQDVLSSKAVNDPQHQQPDRKGRARRRREVGQTVTNTYSLTQMRDVLREALTTKEKGPKVIVAQSECMLNKQRRDQAADQKGASPTASAWCASASA